MKVNRIRFIELILSCFFNCAEKFTVSEVPPADSRYECAIPADKDC